MHEIRRKEDAPALRFEDRRRRRTLKRRLVKLAIVLGGLTLVYAGMCLADYFSQARSAKETSQQLFEVYTGDEPVENQAPQTGGAILGSFVLEVDDPYETPEEERERPKVLNWPDNPQMVVSDAFVRLQRRNRDIVGWLSIDHLLEEPVVLRDNDTYLRRDYLGRANDNGALFLEENTRLTHRPDTYIIFGHNMKTGEMFGCLRNYENPAFYRRDPLLSFNVLYEDGRYVVFSVADVDTQPGQLRHVPFMDLENCTRSQRADYIQRLENLSILRTEVPVDADDQLLLMVTCEGDSRFRRVVSARRLRAGETEEHVRRIAAGATAL